MQRKLSTHAFQRRHILNVSLGVLLTACVAACSGGTNGGGSVAPSVSSAAGSTAAEGAATNTLDTSARSRKNGGGATASSPAPAAVSVGSCSPNNFAQIVNGQSWPSDFCPFSSSSFWNTSLPATPQSVDTNDTQLLRDGPLSRAWRDFTGGDGPVYVASSNDQSVTISCSSANAALPNAIRIPAQARPQAAGDAHMGVIEPDGTEYDFWLANYSGGTTLSANTCAESTITGTGVPDGFSTTSGAALSAGIVTGAQLAAGSIGHALVLTVGCTNGHEYPGTSNGGSCSDGQSAVPVGALVYLTLSDAQIDALPASTVPAYLRPILHALHDYGGYVNDTGETGSASTAPMAFVFEDAEQYAAYGQTPPASLWAQAQGYQNIGGTPATYVDPNAINWPALAPNMEILSGCYAQQNCANP